MKIKVVVEVDDDVARKFVRRQFGDDGKRTEDVKWSIRTWAATLIRDAVERDGT